MLRRHWLRLAAMAAVVSCTGAGAQAAGLSGNLIPNGNFEDFTTKTFTGAEGDVIDWAHFKHEHSPRTEAEVTAGTAPVRAWQFHPEYDLGRWFGPWGTTSLDRGITAWPDPRAAYDQNETVYMINISEDPLNPGNHMLESVFFRNTVGIIVKAPENQTPGQGYINFDYYWNNWVEQPSIHEAASIYKMWLYGFNEADLPSWSERWGPTNHGPANGPGEYDGFLWTNPNWQEWGWGPEDAPGHDEPAIPSLGDQWNTLSVTDPGRTSFTLTETYDYYYLSLYMVIYAEGSPYFWLYEGRPSDTFAIGIDNIVLQVPVEDGVEIPDPVPADFSIDALVNTEDINPFILALTNTTAWLNYARPLLPDGLTDQQIIDYADPNGDGSINTEDIAWFICWLTTPGSCGGGAAAIIPEPASLGLLAAGALALIRRRR